MRRLDTSFFALASVLALTSCGGGGSPTPAPTPTPVVTATPTPTPTPTFSYTAFAELTGDQDFGAACLTYNPFTNGIPIFTGSFWFSSNVLIDYTAATETWAVRRATGAQVVSFGPAELVSAANGNASYEIAGTPLQTLDITVPQAGGDAAVYARTLSYFVTPTVDARLRATCSIGVPTDPGDVPSGTLLFDDLELTGTLISEAPTGGDPVESEIISGSGSISADMDAREVTFNLFYTVRDPGGAETTFGPIQGTIDIEENASALGFFEQISVGPPVWQANGTFYGPQAAELGFSLHGGFDFDENGLNESYVITTGFAVR